MPTKQFSLLQLFNIVMGRLPVTGDDKYIRDFFEHVFDDKIDSSPGLFIARKKLEFLMPEWYKNIIAKIEELKSVYSADNDHFAGIIERQYPDMVFDIPQLNILNIKM